MSDFKDNTKDINDISSLIEAILKKENLKYYYEKSDRDDTSSVFHVQQHGEQFDIISRADIPLVQIMMVWYLSDMFDMGDEYFILRTINKINESMSAKLFFSIANDENVIRLYITASKDFYWLPDVSDLYEDIMANLEYVERLKRLFGIMILEEKLCRTGQAEDIKSPYKA